MKHIITTVAAMSMAATLTVAQTVGVSGHVVDAKTGESVAFANCAVEETGRGTTSNAYGFFSLEADRGARVSVTCMGYEPDAFTAEADTQIVVRLRPRTEEIGEVTVRATVPQTEMTEMGKNAVPIAMIRAMPSFTGEPDVMKAITFLPGVTAGRDGMSDIFVRGGDRGQNLITLDGMKIYNSSHLFGLVSLFNSDIVRNVDVYKGIFPAEYGGRLASVINVLSRDGNTRERNHHLSIGMLSSVLSSEGPIGSGRVTYSLAARAGYNDLFNMAAKRKFYDLDFDSADSYESMSSNYVSDSFYDLNGHIRWRIGTSASLALSGIVGTDFERWGDASRLNSLLQRSTGRTAIRNDAASLTFTKGFEGLFWRTMVAFTSYRNTSREAYTYRDRQTKEKTGAGKKQTNALKDLTASSEVDGNWGMNHWKGGVGVSRYVFSPSESRYYDIDARGARRDSVGAGQGTMRSVESTLYVSDEIRLGRQLSLEVGLRGTAYHVEDTTYARLEPRASLRFSFGPRSSVKAGYAASNQFNHSVVSYVSQIQSEAWIAATRRMPPQHADQWSLGYFFADDERRLNISAEVYYKVMDNLIHYRSLKVLEGGELDKSVATGGDGRAYGLELMATKDFSHGLSANVSYALSKSERKFGSINGGAWFPFLFDRRHQLTLVGMWQGGTGWSASATFNLASGTPFTMPAALIKAGTMVDTPYLVYTDINNRRTPAYHRLDIGAARDYTGKRGVRMRWALNIYNAYAHKNPSSVRYSGRGSMADIESDYTILPSVSYSIWF